MHFIIFIIASSFFLDTTFNPSVNHVWASLVVQTVRNLPALRKTWAKYLGQKDALEKEMATHSSILAWRIPWAEEPGRLQSMGSKTVGQPLK